MTDFTVEEAEFECSHPDEPVAAGADRSSELALEVWNLRKTVMDLNSQLLQVKAELKTHKNLTKNLKLMNVSLQEENASRAKENAHLKLKMAEEEKNLQSSASQNTSLNGNLARQKKMYSSLQMRYNDLDRTSSAKIKDLNGQIEALKLEMEEKDKHSLTEISRLEKENAELSKMNEHLQAIVNDGMLRIQGLESDKNRLLINVEDLNTQVRGIDKFLNTELEQAYESMHGTLESTIMENTQLRREFEEKEFECTQLSAYILREGMQIPMLRKLYNPSPPTVPYVEER